MTAPAGRLPRFAERSYRLTGVGAFDFVFREGRRCEGERLQLVFVPTRSSPARVGYALAKKVLPSAVDRNRVRRILRETVRRNRARLALYDIIIRMKRGCPRSQYPALGAEAERLFARLPAA